MSGINSADELRAGASDGVDVRRGRLTKALALGTLVLVLLGANVTSTESGMADEHWPTFDGRWLPSLTAMSEDTGKLYEHTHRMFAGLVVLFTWGLALRAQFSESRRWVRRLFWTSAGVILLAALLGGLSVLFGTPPAFSVLHVGVVMVVLSVNTALAIVTGSWWSRPAMPPGGAPSPGREEIKWLVGGALACVASVYLQIILGAVLRHGYYGEFFHILWAFVVFTTVVIVGSRVFGRHANVPPLLHATALLVFLLIAQFFLGLTAYVTRPEGVDSPGSGLHQVVATSHQVLGAVMLMASVALLVPALRLRHESGSSVSQGSSVVVNAAQAAAEGGAP